MIRKRLLNTSLIGAALPLALSVSMVQSASGQETAGASPAIDTIVVTSQRREQSLEDVPLSVTVFPAEEIIANNIRDFTDYAVLTPNLAFNEGRASGEGRITIRGIGSLGGEQPTLGVYLDGFELINASTRIYDLERIEVLRGPQGTTFGRNVIAGAINLTSFTPSTDGYSGYAQAEMGSYGLYDVEGGVTLPVNDTTAIRVAGFYRSEDGHIDNLFPGGTDSNDVETFGGRLTVFSEPTDRLTLKGLVSYESYSQGLINDAITNGIPTGNVPTLQSFIDAGDGLVPPGTIPAGPDTYFPDQNTEVVLDTPGFIDREQLQVIGRFDYDFGAFSLIGIGGFASIERDLQRDIDLSEFNTAFENAVGEEDFYSGELRLQSNGDQKLDWVAGVYATKEDSEGFLAQRSGTDMELVTFIPILGSSLLPNNSLLFGSNGTDETTTYSVFGEVDYALTDRLNVIGGVRYSTVDITESIANGVDLDESPLGLLTIVPIMDAEDDVSSEQATWRTSLVYQATDDINLYGTISTGFRAGGLQLNNTERSDFDTESLINYELGAKAFFFDRRASVNFAVFHMEWDDIQIQTFNRTNNQSFTDNVSKAEATGAELEFTLLPFDGLLLSGGVGYVDSELSEFDDPEDGRIGSPLPNTPEWKVNFIADYRRTLVNDVDWFVRGVYIHNDDQLVSLIEEGAEDPFFLEGYERVDLRLGVDKPDDWTIEGYIENLTDDIYATGGNVNGFSASGSAIVSPPQRYGVRFRKEF